MSVDERLRQGLADNAWASTPQVERSLEQVHRRRRREVRAVRAAVAGVAVVVVVVIAFAVGRSAGPSSVEPVSPDPSPTQSGEPEREPGQSVIPDGVYERSVTLAQVRRKGLDLSLAEEILGADGKVRFEFVVRGNQFYQRQSLDDRTMVVGDYGTLRDDDRGRLIAISRAPGCPLCESVLDVHVAGDRLVLAFATASQPTDDERLVMEGAWHRRN